MKLLITGGHISPALAVIDAIINSTDKKIDVIFVGRKFANSSEKNLTFEAQEINKRNIKFIDLQAGRIGESIKKLIIGFIKAFRIIKDERPEAVLTFGSYVGLPIAFAAWCLRIPVYAHEQTVRPGIANQLVGQFATEIFLAFPEAREYFKKEKTVVTGNPIRNQIFHVIDKPFQINKSSPVIYITGGSLGSHSVNVLIESIIGKLLEKYIIIHQVGNVEEFDDYSRISKLRDSLPAKLKQRYFIKQHFHTEEIGYVYSISDMVIGRSGANTFFELVALKKPAILIPLPWSAHGEQERHAEIFQDSGSGILFSQDDSHENLLSSVFHMMDNIHTYHDNFKNLEEYYKRDTVNIILKSYYSDK